MKKMIMLLLVIASLFEIALPATATMEDTISPRYTNASSVKAYLNINTSGSTTIQVICVGKNGLNSTKITTYLQHKVNGVWKNVNVWSHTSTSQSTTKTYSTVLAEKGEYRVMAYFTLTAATTESLTATDTKTY